MEVSISEEELTTIMENVMERSEQPESSDEDDREKGRNLAPHEKYKGKQRPDVTQKSAKIKMNFDKRSTRGQKAKGRFILKMINSSREYESGSLGSLPPDSRSVPSQTAQNNLLEGNSISRSIKKHIRDS